MSDRAMTNQIGIIFMVALAVTASVALGIFAFDLLDGGTDGSTAERGVTFAYDAEAGNLTITYTTGPKTDKSDLYLRGNDPGGPTSTPFGSWAAIDGSGTVTAGDELVVPADGNETVTVVYEGEDTQKVIQTWDGST